MGWRADVAHVSVSLMRVLLAGRPGPSGAADSPEESHVFGLALVFQLQVYEALEVEL